MFSSGAKTPFGTGSFGTTNSSLFSAKTQASPFATPGFGSSTASTFGSGTTSLFGGGGGGSLFSQPSTQPSTGFSFGQTSGPRFGSSSQSTSLFQTPQTSNTFGGQSFGGFGSNPSTTTAPSGLFSSSFGSSTTGTTGGSLFGGSSAFGGTSTNGTTIRFNPVTSSENVNKNGTTMMVQTKHQCISVMKEYEAKSLEELRIEDYAAGRKSGSGSSSLFGGTTQQPQQSMFGSSAGSAFGQAKPLSFGGFTQPTTTSSSLFGQTSQSGGLFSKPVGTGSIFGPTTTTTSSALGFGTSGGLLGQTSSGGSLFGGTSQPSGLFGATSSGFGTTQTTSSGGLFGTGTSTFGQPQSGSLFGATSKPFGFGAASSGTNTFGTSTFGSAGSTGLFGGTATSKPGFSFNPSGTTGFGSTLGTFGGANTSLGGGGLFGSAGSTSSGGGLFGAQNKTGFGTGSSLGFGGASTFGGAGGFGTGTGLAANQGAMGLSGMKFGAVGLQKLTIEGDQSSFAAFQQQKVLQQQLKALANSPFGDSPLFRNLTASRKKDDKVSIAVSSSNATKVASHYKVFSRPSIKVRMKPSPFSPSTRAKLFDKVNEDYGYADTSLTPKKNVRKLILKDRSQSASSENFENSPLRLRSADDDDDDDEELLSRVPAYPIESVDPSCAGSSGEISTPFVESPALRDARKKNGEVKTVEENVTFEPDSTIVTNEIGEDLSKGEDGEDNPCGIVLERADYYTIPNIEQLNTIVNEKGECLVNNFIVGREDYGEVKFLGLTDVRDLNLDEIVSFRRREAEVYPDEYENKPEVGKELNKRSEITLHKVWPNDKSSLTPIKSPERLKRTGFVERLEEKTCEMGAVFLDYKPSTGTWVFRVEHFTRYGLDEQLFEDDDKTDILRKLKMAAEMKAKALESDIEKEKEKAMLKEEAIQKEKSKMLEKESMRCEDMNDDYHIEDETENDTISMMMGSELPEMSEHMDTFSTSIQTAKVSGVNPERVQGMKALLFDYEDDFLSPREKNLLANRSLIGSGVRESKLKQRFDVRKKVGGEVENLDYSSFPEAYRPTHSPSKAMKRTKLLKSTFLSEEIASYGRDLGTSFATTKGVHDAMAPRIIVKAREPQLTPIEHSSLIGKESRVCDAGLANGRRFRVGWGPKLSVLHVGDSKFNDQGMVKPGIKENQLLFGSRIPQGSMCPDFSVTIENVRIGDGPEDDASFLLECLKNTLRHSKIDTKKADAPFIETIDGIGALHNFVDMTEKYRDFADERDIRHQHGVVWDLVNALWGDLDGTVKENLSAYHVHISRRTNLSKWLSKVLAREITGELDECKSKDDGHLDAIFSLLSGQQIEKACKVACDNREFRMALVLSQASGDPQIKHLLREQLGEWIKHGADQYMNVKRLKIFQLLSGLMVGMTAHGEINLCENLDWKRSFALHLWYYCNRTTSIAKALEEYQNAYKGTESFGTYAAPPKPCYASERCSIARDSDDVVKWQPKDICFHLLKLFSKRSHQLEKVLCPDTHTSDTLDYQLCWQLQQVLESLGYTHISEAYHCLIQASFASQLEAYGLWEWAVFVLLHIKDDKRREAGVRDIISRHCRADGECDILNEKEILLVESMEVPPHWIYEAKAQHAHYCSKSYDEAFYLIKAGKWNEAHKVIVTELASDAIIDEDYHMLRDLLFELSLPERSCSIKHWKQSGEVFLNYILLRNLLVQIEKGNVVTSAYNLEDMRGDVTSLICMIGNLKSDTSKERLAQAEMGKKASNLLKVVLGELSEKGVQVDDEEEQQEICDRKYAWSVCDVAPCIATLPLPPDYIQQELEELVCNTDMKYTADA